MAPAFILSQKSHSII